MPYIVATAAATGAVTITCPKCGESYPADGHGTHVCPKGTNASAG